MSSEELAREAFDGAGHYREPQHVRNQNPIRSQADVGAGADMPLLGDEPRTSLSLLPLEVSKTPHLSASSSMTAGKIMLTA